MADRPNILLITTDQQRSDTIHAAGNPAIFTPHLNWLADQGVRFSRAYTDCPVCVAARATIMTGRHGHSNGLTSNAGSPVPMAEHPTLPGLLTDAGYQTRAIGKMHFHPTRGHYGFEHMELPFDYYRMMERQGLATRPKNHGVGENEMEPVFNTVDENLSITRWLCDRTIDFLETRDPRRPFFTWLSFPKPHPPFDCDWKCWQLYDGIDLPDPVRGDWSTAPDEVPDALRSSTFELNNVHRFSPQQLRNVRRAYYACISQIDYNLGYLFARMREMGHLEDTWIIFTSDHGEMLGDHWLGAKALFLEGSAHVPMIVRPPFKAWTDNAASGTVRDELVCLADLLPTLCGMADVPLPEGAAFDGIDLFDERATPRERLFGSCGERHALYEGSYVYSFAVRGGDELLFDLAADPHEQRELIRAGQGGAVLASMRDQMAAFLQRVQPDAFRDGRPTSVGPARREAEMASRRWPGFHSRAVESDVLH